MKPKESKCAIPNNKKGISCLSLTHVFELITFEGFTVVTIIILLALMGAAAGIATLFMDKLVTGRRELATHDELDTLRKAIIGNREVFSRQGRRDFGYSGHMGNLPAKLEDIYKKDDQPGYTIDTQALIGAGWAGPYIAPRAAEKFSSIFIDAFGNSYEYSTTEYTRADGEVVIAKVQSYGADKTLGTEDDRKVEILRREVYSTVFGYVRDFIGKAVAKAQVTMYYPYKGRINELNTTTNAEGFFQFTDVPYGIRAMKVAGPGLRYMDGSALATGGGKNQEKDKENNTLIFKISNWGERTIILNSIKLEYITSQQCYYEQVHVGNTVPTGGDNPPVFDYIRDNHGNRGESGRLIPFSDIAVVGGRSASPTRVLIDSDNVLLSNMVLQAGGGTLIIKYTGFKNKISDSPSPAKPVNVTGVTFAVTFSDGSQFTFTAEAQKD